MSALVLQFPKRPETSWEDTLGREIGALALEKLAHRQLGLLPAQRGDRSVLTIEADRMAELIADRAERNGVPAETQRCVDRIKATLTRTGTPQVVRFPRIRIARTKAQQRRLQQLYKDPAVRDFPPAERFRHCQIALDVETAMAKRARS